MRLSKDALRKVLGFDALIVEEAGTYYVTNIEAGITDAVSFNDVDGPFTLDTVADVVADRIADHWSVDIGIDSFLNDAPIDTQVCPYCS